MFGDWGGGGGDLLHYQFYVKKEGVVALHIPPAMTSIKAKTFIN